jgi:beta-glucosidase-like glycosyl hydrolase
MLWQWASTALLAAVEKGTVSEQRIDESVYRILKIKGNIILVMVSKKAGSIIEINQKVKGLSRTYFQ